MSRSVHSRAQHALSATDGESAESRASRAAGPPYTRGMTASTPELEADRHGLIALVRDEAVFHGDFTLSSGRKASYYVDMRKLTLDHRAAPAIGRHHARPDPRHPRRLRRRRAHPRRRPHRERDHARVGADRCAARRVRRAQGAQGPRSRPAGRGGGCRGQARRGRRGHLDHGSVCAEGRRGPPQKRGRMSSPWPSSSTGRPGHRPRSRRPGSSGVRAITLEDLGSTRSSTGDWPVRDGANASLSRARAAATA